MSNAGTHCIRHVPFRIPRSHSECRRSRPAQVGVNSPSFEPDRSRTRPGGADRAAKSLDSAWLKILRRGELHEKNVLEEYRKRYGAASVVEIARPRELTESALQDRFPPDDGCAARRGAQVVYQATIFDGRLLGYADFLVREPEGSVAGGGCEAHRCCSHSRPICRWRPTRRCSAQQACNSRQAAWIRLGDGTEREVLLDDVVPAFTTARARLEQLADEHAGRRERRSRGVAREVRRLRHLRDVPGGDRRRARSAAGRRGRA